MDSNCLIDVDTQQVENSIFSLQCVQTNYMSLMDSKIVEINNILDNNKGMMHSELASRSRQLQEIVDTTDELFTATIKALEEIVAQYENMEKINTMDSDS